MAQLPWAIGTLAACSLAMCGLRTRPRTDVDPPRVELPSAAGAYRLAALGTITCFFKEITAEYATTERSKSVDIVTTLQQQ